jgi:TetR/AcrR family transcriptional repressor of nem operon
MDTKTQLLDAAEHLARTRGFDAFSYADLSDTVGIRKASIHYHFSTKSDLASSLIQRYASRVLARLDAITTQGSTAADCLLAYIDLYREALGQGETLCLCVSFSASRDSFEAETLSRLARFHEANRTWLADTFAKGARDGTVSGPHADPSLEAQACLALVEGAQIIARAATDETLFDQAVQPFLQRLNFETPPKKTSERTPA